MGEVPEDDLLITGNTPENAVYEAAQEEDLILLALHELDRLVDGRTVRHLIHIQDLVAAHAEHRPDQRLHVFRMGLTELVQDEVDLNRVLEGSLDEPRHEGTIARGPVRMRRQCIAKHDVRELLLLEDLHKAKYSNRPRRRCGLFSRNL